MTSTVENQAAEFRVNFEKLRAEIARAMVGQDEVVRQTLIALVGGGHVLLEGVPGLGKTFLVRTLADALRLKFSRIQFTPDLMPADIIGTDLIVEDEHGHKRFEFQEGPIFTQVLLADEINRATPKTQSALLEAMQEKQLTVSGQTRALGPPFFVLATQNPLEMEGTYPLPEAQLDRFFFKVSVPFPTLDELTEISRRTTGAEETKIEAVIDGDAIASMQSLARQVALAPHVERFAAQVILASHPDMEGAPKDIKQYVRYGASPRALQTLILGSKVLALIEGRYNVAFDDIQALSKPALRHRLIMNFEGEAEGIQTDDLIESIMSHVPREAVGVA